LSKAIAFNSKPFFKFRRVIYEEPSQQRPAVEFGSSFGVSLPDALLEENDIAAECVEIDSDFFGTSVQDDIASERLSEKVQSLSQRRSCMTLVRLWPEEAYECVTPVEPPGLSDGKVAEQRHPLALSQG
jgi:hypothetical protein